MHDADVQHQIVRDKNFTFHDLEHLTNTCFKTNNYLNNFPQVFKNENREFLFLLRYKNKIASFCSLYPFSFQLDGKRLSAYCIGSVCTHPKYRNLGLAHKAIILAEKKAIENSADFIFLFADNHNLYSKLNFIQAGKTYLAQISSNISNQTTKNNLKSLLKECENTSLHLNTKNIEIHFQADLQKFNEIEKAKLWQFIVLHSPPCESILSYLDFCDILKIKNMNVYLIKNGQQILATCFYNKGDDFQNVIHSTYYIDRNYIFLLISKIFLNNKGKDIIFFPGALFYDFQDIFEYISIPSMSIKALNEKKFPINTLQNLCIKNSIFVSSLQGT